MTDDLRNRVLAIADQRAGVDRAWARALALAVGAMVAEECAAAIRERAEGLK